MPWMTAPPLDLDRIYRDHGHVVLRRARRILGDEHEALEVLQEVFLSLAGRPAQFHGRSAPTTFLYRMTTNMCLNRLRDATRRRALLARETAGRTDGAAPRAPAALEAVRLLARLPERLARVAVYHYVDEMTHDEIAELLGCSRRQVGNLVAKIERTAAEKGKAA